MDGHVEKIAGMMDGDCISEADTVTAKFDAKQVEPAVIEMAKSVRSVMDAVKGGDAQSMYEHLAAVVIDIGSILDKAGSKKTAAEFKTLGGKIEKALGVQTPDLEKLE